MLRKFCLLLSAYCLLISTSYADHVPGEMVVKFKPGVIKMPKGLGVASIRAATVVAASVRSLNAKWRVIKLEQIYRDALQIKPDWKHLEDDYLLIFPQDKDVPNAVKDYQKDPNVVSASSNTIVRAFVTPDDTYFSQQWGLTKISAPQGWDRITGEADAEIAVLDTGINYNHEDFSGKVDKVNGKDYVNDDSDPIDDFGHGTAVSGVIGAITNNTKGIAGMDWRGKILPIKVLDSAGRGDITIVNKGIAYVTALKASGLNVTAMNLSLGQYSADSNLEARCSEAYNQGIVLVAAAGNGDVDWKTYPAYYSTILAVAATDSSDKRSVWTGIDTDTGKTQASNYGDWVDVSAPGSNIFSTDKSGGYSSGWNGTSLASPYVAGLAALIRAAYPALSVEQVYSRIKENTDNIDAENPDFVGKLGTGRLNAYKALMGLTAKITYPSTAESDKYQKGTVTVRGTATGWNFLKYRLEAVSGSSLITIEAKTASVESGVLGTWDTTGLDGEYTLRLKAIANDDSSAEASVVVVADNTTPEVSIDTPLPGAKVDGKVSILGKAKDQYFDRYVLEYGAGASPATFLNVSTCYVSVDGSMLGTWETAGLSGTYVLKLTAYDKAGSFASTSEALSLAGQQPPTKEAKAQAGLPLTYVLPNPFDRTATSETVFAYSLEGNFNTTIYLFDLNGNLIWRRNYAAGENGGKAGANTPSWDGSNLFGERVSSGVYLYQVAAERKVIARGKIIVLN